MSLHLILSGTREEGGVLQQTFACPCLPFSPLALLNEHKTLLSDLLTTPINHYGGCSLDTAQCESKTEKMTRCGRAFRLLCPQKSWGMSWHQKIFTENQKVTLGVGAYALAFSSTERETALQNSQRIIAWQTDPNDKAVHRNSLSFWHVVFQIVVLKYRQLIMTKFSFCLPSAIYF